METDALPKEALCIVTLAEASGEKEKTQIRREKKEKAEAQGEQRAWVVGGLASCSRPPTTHARCSPCASAFSRILHS